MQLYQVNNPSTPSLGSACTTAAGFRYDSRVLAACPSYLLPLYCVLEGPFQLQKPTHTAILAFTACSPYLCSSLLGLPPAGSASCYCCAWQSLRCLPDCCLLLRNCCSWPAACIAAASTSYILAPCCLLVWCVHRPASRCRTLSCRYCYLLKLCICSLFKRLHLLRRRCCLLQGLPEASEEGARQFTPICIAAHSEDKRKPSLPDFCCRTLTRQADYL